MNRWTDLLTSFGMSTLLHGLLVLGMIWFWTLRSPELRPMFQGGDVSLAVTFVAEAADGVSTWSVERKALSGGRGTTDPPSPEEWEDQDMLDAETTAPVSAQASANAPAAGSQNADQASKSADAPSAADAPSDALRQGVSGAVRMQSEIRPYYPLGARLRGEEGTVTVRVWVKPSGRASRCTVARSSGFPVLDEAAMDAARRARYVSTRPGAWRVEAETTLTFRFQLTEY